MTYSASTLRCLFPAFGNGPALWYYSNTDAHGTVSGTDYFTDGGSERGMKVNDVVIVVDTDSDTCTIHMVTDVDSDGNATLNAATLS